MLPSAMETSDLNPCRGTPLHLFTPMVGTFLMRLLRPSPRTLGVLRLVLTLACLWALAEWWWNRPAMQDMVLHPAGLLAALGLTPVLLFLRAAKWRACLRGLPVTPSLWESLRSYVGALPLAVITPGRAGELARPLYFKSAELRRVETSGRLLLDNWTDTLAVLLCALPGCFWLWGWRGLAAGLVVFAVLACIPLWLQLAHRIFASLAATVRLQQVGQFLLRLLPPAEVAGPALLLRGIAWGFLAYAIEALQFLLLLRGLGQYETAWLPVFGGLALVHFANSVQVTIAGIGPREAMTVWLLGRLGLDHGALMVAAFLQMALSFLLPAGFGLFLRPVVDNEEKSTEAAGQ
jgi:uncharacterized membrane protein YbhN (UPF0104 family)